jgi:hypothetical protein
MARIDRLPADPVSFLTEGRHETIAALLREGRELRSTYERAPDEPTRNRYKRMEDAWRALAVEQDWLVGRDDRILWPNRLF